METHPYFQILGKLTRLKVPYCVVGLMGASFYGSTLTTYDVDIFVKPEEATLTKVRRLLKSFKLSEVAVLNGEILRPPPTEREVIQQGMTLVFNDPYGLSIDLMNQISGVDFNTVWKARQTFTIGKQRIWVASLKHIITSKSSAGREKDILHLKRLKELNP